MADEKHCECMSYDCLSNICTQRKSTRRYLDQPVPKDTIQKILDIADTAPYGSNKKNWNILVVDDKQLIAKIARTVESGLERTKANLRQEFKYGFSRFAENFTAFESAPVLFIPVFQVSRSISFMMDPNVFSLPNWERDNYVKSISCVSMLILLAAESLGLGSCYMTGPLVAEQEILQLLDVKKDSQLGSIIPVGYAVETGALDAIS